MNVLYFPQLSSGAVSQFPVARSATARTVTNQLMDGSAIRMPDTGLRKVQWHLRYAGLTDTERSSIESLFQAVEGQLGTFTFLDPTDNLLRWSEDLTQAVWTPDPLLLVVSGKSDPFGGSSAMLLTNTAQTSQGIVQHTSAPGSYVYAFSVYARSDLATTIQLVAETTTYTLSAAISLGGSWSRKTITWRIPTGWDNVSFGIQAAAGVQFDLFGAQVEAQPEAGLYKKTTDRGAVYPNTRFSADSLAFTATAPNQNSCDVELISYTS
jgi:hypothetical protein